MHYLHHCARFGLAGVACAVAGFVASCNSHPQVRIAVIPQTEGVAFWESAHTGAEQAASPAGISIYWNAPTREDDVEAQDVYKRQPANNAMSLLRHASNPPLKLCVPTI